jgi:multiple sugar transport system permease protein
MAMSTTSRRRSSNAISYVLLGLLSIYTLFPFVWMVISSLKPRDEIRARTPSFFVNSPTLDNFVRVLVEHNFLE